MNNANNEQADNELAPAAFAPAPAAVAPAFAAVAPALAAPIILEPMSIDNIHNLRRLKAVAGFHEWKKDYRNYLKAKEDERMNAEHLAARKALSVRHTAERYRHGHANELMEAHHALQRMQVNPNVPPVGHPAVGLQNNYAAHLLDGLAARHAAEVAIGNGLAEGMETRHCTERNTLNRVQADARRAADRAHEDAMIALEREFADGINLPEELRVPWV